MIEKKSAKSLLYQNILKQKPGLYQAAKEALRQCDEVGRLEEIAMYVLAPVLVQFVLWVLERAIKQNIKRLYFFARDGCSMYLLALRICKERDIAIECRYLYCSRYAWRIPQFHLRKDKGIHKICLGGMDVTFEKIMKRAGLTQAEAEEIASLQGKENSMKQIMSYYSVLSLKKPLLECEKFIGYIEKHSKEAYQNTIGYLRQEGLFEDVPYAIVDSGWAGSMQQTLRELIESTGEKRRLHGFYFGLYSLPKEEKKEDYDAFFFRPKSGMKRKVYFNNCLFEAIFSSTEGMNNGYAYIDYTYCPLLDKKDNCNRKMIQRHIDYFLIYIDSLLKSNISREKLFLLADASMVHRIMRLFMIYPSKEEAEIYGNYKFSDDVSELHLQKIAGYMSRKELKHYNLLGRCLSAAGIAQTRKNLSAWPEGSISLLEDKGKNAYRRSTIIYKYLLYIRNRCRM